MLGKATVDFVTKTMVALQATSMRKSNEWKRYFDTTPAELSGFWSLALDLDKSYRTHRFMVDVCCCGASFAVVVTHVVFVVVVVVVTAPGFRCDPTAVSPGTLRLCRKGACSVAIASSSTIQSLSSFFSLLLSQLLLLFGGRRTWAKINVLCKSGMDRTSVCMARQSMLPSSTYSTSSCAITTSRTLESENLWQPATLQQQTTITSTTPPTHQQQRTHLRVRHAHKNPSAPCWDRPRTGRVHSQTAGPSAPGSLSFRNGAAPARRVLPTVQRNHQYCCCCCCRRCVY